MKITALRLIVYGICTLTFPVPVLAQSEPAAVKPAAVYIAAYRTHQQVLRSSPEVFHRAVAGVAEYLESRHVLVAQDPVRKRIESADLIPVSTLTNLAREAGASSLLLITVDRPKMKWVKITVEAYDLSGTLLWKETADEGGGLRGKGAENKALAKLTKRLQPRIGGPGLGQAPASEKKVAAAPSGR
ncbi:MAG: hypothetical protein M1423_08090 [Acidobacteria bacterium]|nr:hypothetical protein [Acidobacteriota bacterium]